MHIDFFRGVGLQFGDRGGTLRTGALLQIELTNP